MVIWNQIKAWGWAIVGALVGALGLVSVVQSKRAKKYKGRSDTLTATVNAERVRKRIEKEEKVVLEENKQKIKKEIKEKGTYEDLGSNDW